MDQSTLLFVGIAVFAAIFVAGVGFAFVGFGDSRSEKRMKSMASGGAVRSGGGGRRRGEIDIAAQRRKQVQDTLKELDEKQNAKKTKLTLKLRIERAGFSFSVKAFYIASVFVGLAGALLALIGGLSPLFCVLAGFAAALGVPRWFLAMRTKKRLKQFEEEFANAIDVIVRGVKAGLPVSDCLKIIANEAKDPVGPEFQDLVDEIAVGIPLDEALERLYQRVPTPEVNFFMIVMSIQQKTGGNLSEALSNLSRVLRERKKMRAKIRSLSQEAKSSAAIIAALPPGVMIMIYLVRQDYMSVLFEETVGQMIVAGSALWMLMGVLVMRKMINFKF